MHLLRRVVSGTSAAVLSLSTLLTMGFTGVAHAAVQTCTWTGAGADDKFSTVANWSGCGAGAPQAGDILVINATSIATGRNKLVNDLGLDFGGIETNYDIPSGQSPAEYDVWISQLSIADGGYAATVTTNNYKYEFIIGDGTNIGSIVGKGLLELRGYSPYNYFNVAGTLKIAKVSTTDYVIIRVLPDTQVGSIDIVGNGYVVFGNQTKDVTTINSDVPITIESGSDATLYFLSACAEFGGMGTNVKANCKQSQATTHNYTGALTLNETTTFTSDEDATVNMTGAVTGKDKIVRSSGSGVLNIGGSTVTTPAKTTNYTDAKDAESITVVENETAIMGDGSTRSSVTVESGGLLKGNGVLKNLLLVVKGATVAPGMSPGCLTSDTLSLYGEYQFELGGTDSCTGYDQLKVTNTTLTSPTVTFGAESILSTSRFNGYTPKQGQVFTIIDVAGTQAIQGTFKDLPEGATFTQNGVVFKISYVGGTGNDVTLTVQNQPTAPDTGFALISANPVLTLVVTAGAALLLIGVARKTRPAPARAHARRRK